MRPAIRYVLFNLLVPVTSSILPGSVQLAERNFDSTSTKFGLGNVAVTGYSATVGYPDIYMADGYLAGGSTYKPYHVKDQNYQFTDSFTWSGLPRHEMKFGVTCANSTPAPTSRCFPPALITSTVLVMRRRRTFITQTSLAHITGREDQDIADLVLGLPTDVDIGLQLTNPHTKSWNLDFYAQGLLQGDSSAYAQLWASL